MLGSESRSARKVQIIEPRCRVLRRNGYPFNLSHIIYRSVFFYLRHFLSFPLNLSIDSWIYFFKSSRRLISSVCYLDVGWANLITWCADFTPLNFFVWSHMKTLISESPLNTFIKAKTEVRKWICTWTRNEGRHIEQDAICFKKEGHSGFRPSTFFNVIEKKFLIIIYVW